MALKDIQFNISRALTTQCTTSLEKLFTDSLMRMKDFSDSTYKCSEVQSIGLQVQEMKQAVRLNQMKRFEKKKKKKATLQFHDKETSSLTLQESILHETHWKQTIYMLFTQIATYIGRSTFANPKYLKKSQSDKPRLYEIPYDTSDPANKFCPNGEETVTLEKESRSKNGLVIPNDKRRQIIDNPTQHKQQNVFPSTDNNIPSHRLDLLWSLWYDEFFNDGTFRVNKSFSPIDDSAQQDTLPSTNIHPTTEPSSPTNVHAEENNDDQAEFTNPFCTPIQEAAESSSRKSWKIKCAYL
ncbi:hypothetical protein Tco_1562077 [Tanacetum coccineum]